MCTVNVVIIALHDSALQQERIFKLTFVSTVGKRCYTNTPATLQLRYVKKLNAPS